MEGNRSRNVINNDQMVSYNIDHRDIEFHWNDSDKVINRLLNLISFTKMKVFISGITGTGNNKIYTILVEDREYNIFFQPHSYSGKDHFKMESVKNGYIEKKFNDLKPLILISPIPQLENWIHSGEFSWIFVNPSLTNNTLREYEETNEKYISFENIENSLTSIIETKSENNTLFSYNNKNVANFFSIENYEHILNSIYSEVPDKLKNAVEEIDDYFVIRNNKYLPSDLFIMNRDDADKVISMSGDICFNCNNKKIVNVKDSNLSIIRPVFKNKIVNGYPNSMSNIIAVCGICSKKFPIK